MTPTRALLTVAVVVTLTAGAVVVVSASRVGKDNYNFGSDPPPPPQNTSTVPQIVSTAYDFLESHQLTGTKWGLPFHFYRPSLQKYSPDQWLWDGGSHQIVWTHRNATNAILSLRTMLSMQQPDGRVPEEIMWGPQSLANKIELKLEYSSDRVVDLTQMPVLPYALRAIYNQTKDAALIREFLPPLVRYFRWWANTRDLNNDSLVTILHGWESGLDASPMYDLAYNITAAKPSYWSLYPKFDELILSYKWLYGWNQTTIVRRDKAPSADSKVDDWFLVEDVGVNSVYADGWCVLSDMATIVGNATIAKECATMCARVTDAIVAKMWNQDLNRFVTLFKDPQGVMRHSPVEGVQSLFPLLLSGLPGHMVESIVTTQLTNASKFWTPFPVPSVSKDAPQFTPVFTIDLMWRGPTWGFPNWFVMEGLTKHGYTAVAEQMLDRWIALVEKSGIWEMYNPLTGAPYGAVGLGMSTLIVDWLYRLGRV